MAMNTKKTPGTSWDWSWLGKQEQLMIVVPPSLERDGFILRVQRVKEYLPLFFRVFFFSNNIINWLQKYFRPTERLLLLVSRTQRWIKTNRGRLIQVFPPRIVCLGRGWIEMPVGHGNNTEGLCSLAHSWTLSARTRTHKCSCGGHAHNSMSLQIRPAGHLLGVSWFSFSE